MNVVRALVSALLAALFATVVAAQSPPRPGDRVRVQLSGLRLTGTLVESTDRTLRIASEDGGEHLLPWADVAEASRSTGKRSGRRAFFLGLGASALVGGTVWAATWDQCDGCWYHPASRADAFEWGFLGGAVLGLGVGAVAAGIASRERWEPLAIPGTAGTALTVRPLVGPGFGLEASLAFGGG